MRNKRKKTSKFPNIKVLTFWQTKQRDLKQRKIESYLAHIVGLAVYVFIGYLVFKWLYFLFNF